MVRGSGSVPPTGVVQPVNERPRGWAVRWTTEARLVPLAPYRYPRSVISRGGTPGHDSRMEVITPRRPIRRAAVAPLLGNTVFGTLFLVGGMTMAYMAYATPLLAAALPAGRPDAAQMIMGVAIWAVALVAPAGLIIVGTNRLARILATARGRRPTRASALRGFNDLPDDVTVASDLTLPDGRGLSHVVIGQFGMAVIRELPSPKVTRVREGRWQLRTARGWIPLTDPLDMATRDAERVRRWITDDDSDFIVKIYAAVVGADPQVARTPGCAVLTPDQLVAWIAGLPPQRSLTQIRRERMLDIARDAAR